MRICSVAGAVGLMAMWIVPAIQAQEAEKSLPAPAVYRAEFIIRDGSDAAAKAGRRYTVVVDAGGRGNVRVGHRVPYATASFQPGTGSSVNPLVSTQYQYFDVGVSIDCRLRDLRDKVGVTADIDISTVIEPQKTTGTPGPMPTVASVRLNISSAVTPGKPTLVAAISDPVTNRKFEVEAIVTPLQ